MFKHIKWASGSATHRNITVGPRHDPYSRDIVELEIDRFKFEMVSCALAGDYMINICRNGEKRVIRRDVEGKKNFDAICIGFTGQTHAFWMDRVWTRRNRAAYRKDPEAYELAMEMEYAYDRMYAGCM